MGHLSTRGSMKGPMKEDSFTGDPESYVKLGLEMGVCFHGGHTFGKHGWALLS